MSRLPQLRYDDLGPDGQKVWDGLVGSRGSQLISADGSLIGPFNAFVTAPGVGGRVSSLGRVVRFETSIDRRLTELAVITVAARWQAEFEWWAHAQMAREHGVDGPAIDAIGRGEEPQLDGADERVVYRVARELAVDGRLSAEAYDAAQRLLGDQGTVELVTLCGYYTMISFMLNAFRVPLPPGNEPTWADGESG
ncbi:MAG TPA: carboxymuconolactone decarboxylase family protein [Streptosporangiaceae bacterium]|jgi:4-carboxymuconolactone decarboxylase